MNTLEEKVFFCPGDLVKLKHNLINNIPIMYVVKKETRFIKAESENDSAFKDEHFIGIRCRWFTLNHELQEAVFNTKDLIKL